MKHRAKEVAMIQEKSKSKMKGRASQPDTPSSLMGAEKQKQRDGQLKKRLRDQDEESDQDDENDLHPYLHDSESDSETSEDEEEEPSISTKQTTKNNNSSSKPVNQQQHQTNKKQKTSSSSSTTTTTTSPSRPSLCTVSIAVPGSIISNAQSPELRSYLAGQIARAAAVFNIDEVIVFRETGPDKKEKYKQHQQQQGAEQEQHIDTRDGDSVDSHNMSSDSSHLRSMGHNLTGEFRGAHRSVDPNLFLARLLQYLETPQYLRKLLFPVHPDLQYAGLMNPLDAPHHVRANEDVAFREGVVTQRPTGSPSQSWVNVGLLHDVLIDRSLPANTRVTIQMWSQQQLTAATQITNNNTAKQKATSNSRVTTTSNSSVITASHNKRHVYSAVSPSVPRYHGLYWGYTTRLADSFSAIFNECPYQEGYDLTIGTSDKGRNIQSCDPPFVLPPYRHLLIVFGGLAGLEESIAADEEIKTHRAEDVFSLYLNTCQDQGSRTIRTEEAILITLSALRPYIITHELKATS